MDRQFTHAAYHDAPTGLPNDSFLLNRLERGLQRIRLAEAGGIAVLHVHPLQFEAVAAACSHGSPDLILIEAAQRVEGCLRPSDLVVARSGMNITVMLYGVSSVEAALAAAQRILETFDESLEGADGPLYLKVRIGVSHASTGFEQPRQVLRHASIAAMTGGERPGVQVFDQTANEELVSLQQIESDLRGALEHRSTDSEAGI